MPSINPTFMQIAATFGTAIMALLVIFVRIKSSHRAVTVKKIIMPPVGMSTGLLMFVYPPTHFPLWWGLIAFACGWILFSYPLVRSTKFEVKDGQVFAQRSQGFAFILLGLLAIRLILHEFIQQYVTIPQTGGIFFLLAFGMILRWRLFMLKEYNVITAPNTELT